MSILTRSQSDRFWKNVKKSLRIDGCWIWEGSLDTKGYGQIGLNYKVVKAHQFMIRYILGNKISEGFCIDHICRVRNCVNPEHLQIVSFRENTLIGFGPAAIAKRRNTCARGHAYTQETTRIDHTKSGNSFRVCRLCDRNNSRLKRLRRKEKIN